MILLYLYSIQVFLFLILVFFLQKCFLRGLAKYPVCLGEEVVLLFGESFFHILTWWMFMIDFMGVQSDWLSVISQKFLVSRKKYLKEIDFFKFNFYVISWRTLTVQVLVRSNVWMLINSVQIRRNKQEIICVVFHPVFLLLSWL